ncbi:MAG TPA: MFS transporter [Bryobacteraceae bacterium]|nr:MFS transporter [Bryobacteraceae bacterium]
MSQPAPVAATSAKWTTEQKRLIVLLFLMNALNYLDRSALSAVAPLIRAELHLSAFDYAMAVNGFLVAYSVMYAGSGLLVDKLGYRIGLALFVGTWSIACGLHAAITGLTSLVAFRFLLGIAEPGGFTGGVKTLAARFDGVQRPLATGFFTAGSAVGGALAPPLIIFLASHFGWRNAFLFPAAAGFLWLFAWWRTTPSSSVEHPRKSGPIFRVSWLRNPAVIAYILVRFFGDSTGYFFAFWVPEYLVSAKHFSLGMVGMLAWIPPCFTDAGAVLGGYISGYLVKRGQPAVLARKKMMTAAGCILVVGSLLQRADHIALLVAGLSVCTFAVGVWAANLHTLPADAFPQPVVASIHGIAGSAGAIGGVLFNTAIGHFAGHGQFGTAFFLVSTLMPCGVTALWLWMRESRVSSVQTAEQ